MTILKTQNTFFAFKTTSFIIFLNLNDKNKIAQMDLPVQKRLALLCISQVRGIKA